MALYFHDQCQNDSKTQHVLSGKWWVFTDKLFNPYVCPGGNVLIRTKCMFLNPAPLTRNFTPGPFFTLSPTNSGRKYAGRLLKANCAAQPKGCSACFVPQTHYEMQINRDFTLSPFYVEPYEPAEPQIPIYDKCPSFFMRGTWRCGRGSNPRPRA